MEGPVRFHEGSRAEQTPVALYWQGRWRPVRLVSESLLEQAGAERIRRRLILVQDRRGNKFRLEGGEDKPWRIQPLAGD